MLSGRRSPAAPARRRLAGRAVLGTVLCVFTLGAGAGASAATNPIAGCDNASDSALNEYCPSFPTATGTRIPTATDQSLAKALPAAAGAQLARDPSTRVLGRLPAAQIAPGTPATRARTAEPTIRAATASAFPLWGVGLIAISLLGMLGARVRQRRPRDGR